MNLYFEVIISKMDILIALIFAAQTFF